jgi:hypothetical protein
MAQCRVAIRGVGAIVPVIHRAFLIIEWPDKPSRVVARPRAYKTRRADHGTNQPNAYA